MAISEHRVTDWNITVHRVYDPDRFAVGMRMLETIIVEAVAAEMLRAKYGDA